MLRRAIADVRALTPPRRVRVWPELIEAAEQLAKDSSEPLRFAEIERLLIDGPTESNKAIVSKLSDAARSQLQELRDELFESEPPIARDARIRYSWVRTVLDKVQKKAPAHVSWRSRITDFFNKPVPFYTCGL